MTPVPHTDVNVRPLADIDRPGVGEIYVRAFADKTRFLVGRHTAAAGPIMAELVPGPPDAWVAEVDGRLAGVAYVQDPVRPQPHQRPWALLRRRLPPFAAIRGTLFVRLLHGVFIAPDRLYLDSLAVDPEFQGSGVGKALLDRVVDEARARDKAAVCLYVIDRNLRARAIYRRYGFAALHSERLVEALAWITSFGHTDYMELALQERVAPPVEDSPRGVTARLNAAVDAWIWHREPPIT